MFRIGQKVVRVGSGGGNTAWYNANRDRIGNFSFPAVGDVVTIQTINVWPNHTLLTFREHDNSRLIAVLGCKFEPGFDSRHFRPVVERKTDISIFKALLNPTKQTERV